MYPRLKKNVNLQHYFFRLRAFSDVSAATLISVLSLWSFRLVVFLCKRDCFDDKNKA